MAALPSAVAFGPIVSPLAQPALQHLRDQLHHSPLFAPLLESLQQLPELWSRLHKNDAALAAVHGLTAASDLAAIGGSATAPAPQLQIVGNITDMPLTVLVQLIQYFNYLNCSRGHITHEKVLESVRGQGGVQGFCAGLLTALAVASAANLAELFQIARSSVQLAFCIGAYVDLDRSKHSGYTSLAVRWKTPTPSVIVNDLLAEIEDAYVSVIRDENDVTITVSTDAATALATLLKQHGAISRDIKLNGRYHCPAHEPTTDRILELCKDSLHPHFGKQDVVRTNSNAQIMPADQAVRLALQSILSEKADWYSTVSASVQSITDVTDAKSPFLLSVGADAVPSSIAKKFTVVKVRGLTDDQSVPISLPGHNYPQRSIAIVGMACKFPGADSIPAFWDLLTQGTSMLSKVPKERFDRTQLSRAPKGLEFWGNFINDIDAFDHKLFKKSAREAASMDPQQRLLLQVAYQALESCGYFADASAPRDTGCYIGACATDYDSNVGCHPASAYSTIGTLRAFLSGKISHYFGWSGPSLTYDTACSSSAVAIHSACTALQLGECSQAVAGGVALFTSPYLYENLAAAHFLSPTGATKPFDAKGDGYCRGEGVGLVVLKRLEDALAKHDNILGVIAGSGLNQNANCVPIVVPHSPSQGDLYRRVASQAGINPQNITFVEAHGTGTPVGDPIEMESIRTVFGGANRTEPLFVSSVKGNIGHLEGASGVASLIKALLQMHFRTACPQASFNTLNPKIRPLEVDKLSIPRQTQPLPTKELSAIINNYGAAGSNAAMLLMEAPKSELMFESQSSTLAKYPIQITAASTASLVRYCQRLRTTLEHHSKPAVADVAFNLSRQQNAGLPCTFTTAVSTVDELISALPHTETSAGIVMSKEGETKPVVLCFGGQVGTSVGLNKRLWEQSSLFRHHLDECDRILRDQGYESIYPAIFNQEPIADVALLQPAIFACQYSSARAWIDSGLQVAGLVGHSLGQFAALCVSGMISLQDAIRFVAGRATLMKKHWGIESGSMIAVETDASSLRGILSGLQSANKNLQYEVACFNGPTSQVVVSDRASADQLEAELGKRSTRYKRLSVTHGFHSRFTEPLMPYLERLAGTINFRKPEIPVETCTEFSTWTAPSGKLLASHTRDPVYFGQAIERLEDRLGACTFLEAGSNSSVAGMVRRALPRLTSLPHVFVPVQLNTEQALDQLVEVTMNLWGRGNRVRLWNYHPMQSSAYKFVLLPPYQFEETRHWLKLEVAPPIQTRPQEQSKQEQNAIKIPQLVMLRETHDGKHLFDIGLDSEEYQTYVSKECPPSVFLEMVLRSISLVGEATAEQQWRFHDVLFGSILSKQEENSIELQLVRQGGAWSFEFHTRDATSSVYCRGSVTTEMPQTASRSEFAQQERLISRMSATSSAASSGSGISIKGPLIYQILSRSIQYANFYRNVDQLTADDSKLIATVCAPDKVPMALQKALVSPQITENFFQLAILHVNCLSHVQDTQASWTFEKVDRIEFSPAFHSRLAQTESWNIVCLASIESDQVTEDIFVRDATTGKLIAFLLGIRLVRGQSISLGPMREVVPIIPHAAIPPTVLPTIQQQKLPQDFDNALPRTTRVPNVKSRKNLIYDDFCDILDRIADVPKNQVRGNASFEDMGVDSLMMIEVIGELSKFYEIDLPVDELEKLTDVDSLVNYLASRGVRSGNGQDSPDSCSSSDGETAATSVADLEPEPPMRSQNSAKDSIKGSQLAKLLAEALDIDHSEISPSSNLAELGLDSLLCIELASDIEKMFGVVIDMEKLDETSIFADLLSLTFPGETTTQSVANGHNFAAPTPDLGAQQASAGPCLDIEASQRTLEKLRHQMHDYCDQTGFGDFWSKVYPSQARLVECYIIEAWRDLGCNLAQIAPGHSLPQLSGVLPKHDHLIARMRKILTDGGYLAVRTDKTNVRTAKAIDGTPASVLHAKMLQDFPLHASETKLLHATGSQMAQCLLGKVEPLQVLFANKVNRGIMADVYENAPMCQASTRLLADFLVESSARSERVMKVIEIGAGTGGTARYLIKFLAQRGVKFEYTFTDISSSLVAQAKRSFADQPNIKFLALDCDKIPADLCGQYDVVVATNVVHATHNATTSVANITKLLSDTGIFCLVEFTNGLYWFDMVYGLLEGWWLFSDGRQHALADEWFWNNCMKSAGLQHVSWTDGASPESRTMRLICGFKTGPADTTLVPAEPKTVKKAGLPMETFVWKRYGNLELKADVYYPKTPDSLAKKRPVALMIHGGGHLLFSRADIPMKHVRELLQRGYLPVSVDYRLCPEMSLYEGPVSDCCDSLEWARNVLPSLQLSGPQVTIDASKLLALGWSSGGQLAMTLGYTARQRGIRPPEVILPFYSPSDLEADFWSKPIFPAAAEEPPVEIWGELDCVRPEPILEYTPMSNKRATALSLTLKDDRARLILHMNWKGQSVNVLVRGLPNKSQVAANDKTDWKNLPPAPVEKVRQCSPYWHILQGTYATPTFMVHGNIDDWIPYQMTQKTIKALQERKVPCGILIPDQCGHAFDLFPKEDRLGLGWGAIEAAYDFAAVHLQM